MFYVFESQLNLGRLQLELRSDIPPAEEDKILNGMISLTGMCLFISSSSIVPGVKFFSPSYYISKYQKEILKPSRRGREITTLNVSGGLFTTYDDGVNYTVGLPLEVAKEKLALAFEVEKILLKYPSRSTDADTREYQEIQTEESNEFPSGDSNQNELVRDYNPHRDISGFESITIGGTTYGAGDRSDSLTEREINRMGKTAATIVDERLRRSREIFDAGTGVTTNTTLSQRLEAGLEERNAQRRDQTSDTELQR
jgi:hypothetical protein